MLKAGTAGWRRGLRSSALLVVQYAVLVAVAFLVLYPLALLVLGSFQSAVPGAEPSLSLSAWSTALTQPGIRASLWNTLALVIVRQAISFVVAIAVAWAIARTDIPGRRWLEFLFLVAFFLPTIPVVEAWILLLDPDYGIVNSALAAMPFVHSAPFDIYSFAGVIWVHLAHGAIAIKIVLLVPLFRTMDASLEEMGRLCGLSTLGTVVRITIPILAPGLLIVLLIGTIATMQTFEIEQILGPPFRFSIFSTEVFRLINRDPPNYPAATALSTFILITMVPFMLGQRRISTRSSATLSGRFRGTAISLGRWRRPVFTAIFTFALFTTVMPLVILAVFSFATKWGYYAIPHPWTTSNWTRVFTDRTFLASLGNSLELGTMTAIAGMIGFSAIGYIIVRARFAGRASLDVLTWLPSALPGIILSLGLLDLYLGWPVFRPLYGSMSGMVLAAFMGAMTVGVQVIKSNLMQIGGELEESARVAGGNWWQAYRRIVLPLTMPTVLLCGSLSFALAVRNVSGIVFLNSADTRPLSLLQLDYMTEGWYEPACVVGIVLALITATAAALGSYYSARFEIAR